MEEKNIFQIWVLSVFTLGIYYLYWIYSTTQLVNSDKKIPPLLEVLLGIVTFKIYFVYWHYITAKKVHLYAQNKGYKGLDDKSIICLLVSMLPMGGYMSMGLIQTQLNTLYFLENRNSKVS